MDTFGWTILFIALATFIGAFIRGRLRDKCVRDFNTFMVTLEETNNKTIWGRLRVESTGIELVYDKPYLDKDGHEETSYLLYKHEYPVIQALIRFHNRLGPDQQQKRQASLDRTCHPNFLRRSRRKLANIFKTVRDSLVEVSNVLLSRVKKAPGLGSTLATQDKYVNQMKQDVFGAFGTSYEPMLERYIGHKVILELIKGDNVLEYCGVLKDYTAEFVEVMDVDYQCSASEPIEKADLVVLRKYGIVRHCGE